MKHCRICHEAKPLSEFYRAAAMCDGHRSECKSCNLAVQAQYRRIDPESHRERAPRWAQANPERVAARAASYGRADENPPPTARASSNVRSESP